MNNEQTPETGETNSRSNIVFAFADDGRATFHVGADINVSNLYGAADELGGLRETAGIPLAPRDARRSLTIMFDAEGEPMARCGPGLYRWDVATAAGMLRLLADIRATGYLMQAEQNSRMASLLVPGQPS